MPASDWPSTVRRVLLGAVVSLAVVAISGCALDLPPPPPPDQLVTAMPSKAIIYAYRLRPLGPDPLGTVSVDCGYPVTLGDDEFTQFFAPPGAVTCSMTREGLLKLLPVSGAGAPVHLSAVAGKSYYLRVVMAGNYTAVTENFSLVDPDVAQAEIRHCTRR